VRVAGPMRRFNGAADVSDDRPQCIASQIYELALADAAMKGSAHLHIVVISARSTDNQSTSRA